jgi:hypothetical protein
MAQTKIDPGWFSIRGAAEYTGFSVTAIRTAIKEDKFPVSRVTITGSGAKDSARIKKEHLDAWIEGRPIEQPTTA